MQHKLTIMRKQETSTASFRRLLREISTLLCYEVTRDLALTEVEIETPLQTMSAPTLEGKKLVFASVLRAGNGLLEGMLDLVPAARVSLTSASTVITRRCSQSSITSRRLPTCRTA